MYIQLYKFLNWFHSGDDFCPSFLPPEIQNDLTASNETTAVSATDPNLDARLFTFFTGDTQTVVVVGALLPQTRRFLQVWENSEWNFPWFWGWWFFSNIDSKSLVLHPDLQKWLAFTTSRLPRQLADDLRRNSTPASTLPLHPPAPVPCSPASLCWIQGVDLWKTPDGCRSRFTAF